MEKKTLDFCERIEQFVQSKLSQYIPENLADKVIHDTIWGSVAVSYTHLDVYKRQLKGRLLIHYSPVRH